MTKTLRDSYETGLRMEGETKLKETSRYKVYSRKAGGYYYIGSHGSLRFGQTVVGSIPCSVAVKNKLIALATVSPKN